eukprot:Phypoly_transcript_09351.p1 GENE.Phypoly_transcript_09351~~Phypoly_transcript_09351.p1  ORF type:complete len:322 (+),score=69.74 Phypoly_transcript_09351:325-1290(+)
MEGRKETALQRLLNEPKGKTTYTKGEAFILYVFWEAPSLKAAQELLNALSICGTATHRNTPCVPTYFFRISQNDMELTKAAIPKTVGEHKQLAGAIKRVRVGTPKDVVSADLVKKGIDPSFLDLDLGADLPSALQIQPVTLEFVEVYLDEKAFFGHSGSRDFLNAYGTVMQPALQNSPPQTFRLGTPTSKIIDTILDPMLKEKVVALEEGCVVWQHPTKPIENPFILSLDIPNSEENKKRPEVLQKLQDWCTTCITLPHPLRPSFSRLFCVFFALPPPSILSLLSSLSPLRIVAHTKIGKTEVKEEDSIGVKEIKGGLEKG